MLQTILRKKQEIEFLDTKLNISQKRQAIRVTWGSVLNHSEFTVKTIFVIGREHFNEENEELQKEINLHKDILIGDYIDSYRNNTLKVLF